MGLLDRLTGGFRMKDPVRGTAQVVSCSAYQGGGVGWQTCRMQLVVQAEGVPATSVEFKGQVRHDRWPSPGITLPVSIERQNPQRVKVEWDEVESARDHGRRTADDLAAAMRGDAGVLGGMVAGGQVNVQGDVSQLSEEQRAKLRMLGIDLPAAAAQDAPAVQGDDDAEVDERLVRLERLAQLRDQGVLTEAEFEDQKRQILDG